jgi:transcriptional regulator with XRE-family HTH domain
MPKSIHQAPYQLLCATLVKERKAIGMSQYQLAERLNKPQSFVAKIERHERRLDVIEFLEIANALQIDPCEIIRLIMATYPYFSETNHS